MLFFNTLYLLEHSSRQALITVILPLCLLTLEGQLCVSFFQKPVKLPCSGSSSYVDLIGWGSSAFDEQLLHPSLTNSPLFERKRKL